MVLLTIAPCLNFSGVNQRSAFNVLNFLFSKIIENVQSHEFSNLRQQ